MAKFESLVVFFCDDRGTMEEMKDDIWSEFNDLLFDAVFGDVDEGFYGRIWGKLKIYFVDCVLVVEALRGIITTASR